MDRRTFVKAASAAMAVGALGVGGVVTWRRWAEAPESQPVMEPHPDLPGKINWIKPNLRQARVIIPDRPHDVSEVLDPTKRDLVKRLRTFFVNSSARRLRLPDETDPTQQHIVIIGDSVTFGWGVDDNEAWPALLQQTLQDRGRKVVVHNAGVPANGLDAMVHFLSKIGPSMGLSGVVFARRPPPGADPAGNYARAIHQTRSALPNVKLHVVLPPISTFDLRGSRAWEGELAALSGSLPCPVDETTPFFREAQQSRKGHRLEARDGRQKVLRFDTDEVVLDLPGGNDNPLPEIYRLFEDDPSVREPLFYDHGHPDAEGTQLLAPRVADLLERAGWFA